MRRSSSSVSGPIGSERVFVAMSRLPRSRRVPHRYGYARRMRDRVLVLNAGSSTLKASVLVGGSDDAKASVTVPMRGVGDAPTSVSSALREIVTTGIDLGSIRAAGHR